jgi:hypothetical protein
LLSSFSSSDDDESDDDEEGECTLLLIFFGDALEDFAGSFGVETGFTGLAI